MNKKLIRLWFISAWKKKKRGYQKLLKEKWVLYCQKNKKLNNKMIDGISRRKMKLILGNLEHVLHAN